MKDIFLITDYHDRFGSKYTARPYRSGMDKSLLTSEFRKSGLEAVFIRASEVFEKICDPSGSVFLYTSLEDKYGEYKSFIEDVVLALESLGAIVIPGYRYLRGHNNKVFMELLRKKWGPATGDNILSQAFGSLEDLKNTKLNVEFPIVIKKTEGYKSRGVYLAGDFGSLVRKARKLCRTKDLRTELKDIVRTFFYEGFKKESLYRRKFIIQKFIPGLESDYKILIFGDKYYVLQRSVRDQDFRASGSGLFSYPEILPAGLLDFSERVFRYFDVPAISLDIGCDKSRFYVFEIQFIYFGTYTIEHSEFCFKRVNQTWEIIKGRSVLEAEYAGCISDYLYRKGLMNK